MEDKHFGFTEIYITKREDGEGYRFVGKGTFNGEPCTIDVPMLQQPKVCIERHYDKESLFGKLTYSCLGKVSFELIAEVKPEDEKYYSVTVDPKFYTQKQIKNLQSDIEQIENDTNDRIRELNNKIEELRKSIQ